MHRPPLYPCRRTALRIPTADRVHGAEIDPIVETEPGISVLQAIPIHVSEQIPRPLLEDLDKLVEDLKVESWRDDLAALVPLATPANEETLLKPGRVTELGDSER